MVMRGRSKYGAKKTAAYGRTYDSKSEKAYSDRLRTAQRAGKLAFFLEQVPLRLAGGTVFRIDFVEFWNTEEEGVYDIRWVDVKSPATEAKYSFRMKRTEIEAAYPIQVECRDKHGNAVGDQTKAMDTTHFLDNGRQKGS